ncbi:MAG: HK97-gp10 family putative phage morphogenesis protein [Clostridiaceae bacterium]|nr:HK97-gp10 family putative phage morphogenesis protein [Clostridiaceae bacterium]
MKTKYYGGKGKYGSSALSASLTVSGLDEYLAKIQAAGNNIEEACKAAVNAAAPIVEADMKAGAERHKDSGDVVDAIEAKPAETSGYGVWASVGIDMEKHPEAIHAVYQEYGDGHSPGFPDPFVRPAFDNNKAKIKAAEKAELKKWGVPIE